MRAALPLLLLGALSLAAPAAAQPMDTYGLSSRSVAMGGAVTADVEDFSANYYNPAGVASDTQLRIGVGWFGVGHELALDGIDSGVDPVTGMVVGLNVPGNVGDFRFAFGLALHLNDQRVSRTRSLPRQRPRWELYDNRPHRTFLAAHVAIEPVEWLRIGGGIAFLSTSAIDLSIRGTLDITQPERLSRLEHEINGDLLTIRYPQVGVQVSPTDWLDLGVVYRGEYALSSELVAEVGACAASGADGCTTPDGGAPESVNITVGSDGSISPIPGYFYLLSSSVNAYVPHQLSFAASVTPIPDTLRVSVELTWLLWSAYRSPIGTAAIDLVIDVPPELSDQIMIPPIADTFPLAANFSDRVVPRLGVEYTALRIPEVVVDLRLGYFYENSPAPPQTGFTNLVDADRHAFSLGAGFELLQLRPLLPGSLAFDVHFQYGYLPARVMQKTSPIDPIGDYTAEGHIFAGGLTMEARFE